MRKLISILFLLTFLNSFSEDLIGGSNINNLKESTNLYKGELENGLKYYIYPKTKPSKKVYMELVVGSGSLVEKEEERGLAHFIEHMAFNGTKKYPKNEIIDFLRSQGLSFGGDLNAHTSFAETVYKLNINSDDKSVEDGLGIFNEWAHNITFNQEDIDSEKGVITEEWRLSQGLSRRYFDALKESIYGKSRYTNRFPIGLLKNIKNADRETLLGYYKKWYQPKNMAIIVVGDVDPKVMGKKIEDHFNKLKNENYKKPPYYEIGNGSKDIVVFSDPELTINTFDIIIREPRRPVTKKTQYKDYFKKVLYDQILSRRFAEKTKKKDTNIRKGIAYTFDITKNTDIHSISITLPERKVKEGIDESISMLKEISINGVTKEELNIEKHKLEEEIKESIRNKINTPNTEIAREIKKYHQNGEIFSDLEYQYETYNSIKDEITPELIKEYGKSVYNSSNKSYFLAMPRQSKLSEKKVKKIIEKSELKTPGVYTFVKMNEELETSDIKEGSILTKEETKDYTRYTLSNGVEVIAKDTKFQPGIVNAIFFKKSGTSNLSDDEFTLSRFFPIIFDSGSAGLTSTEISNFKQSNNIKINQYIRDYLAGTLVETKKESLESSLALMYSYLVDGRINDEIYENILNNTRDDILNRNKSPKKVYDDEVKSIASQGYIRRKPLTLKDLKSANKEDILRTYKKMYGNFKDGKLVIVGDLEGVDLDGLMKKYVASLPSTVEVTSKKLPIDYPKGIVKKEVIAGDDDKSYITLIYPYEGAGYSYNKKVLYLASTYMLQNMLIEDVREKMGEIYTVSVSIDFAPINGTENALTIRFACDPEKRDMVVAEVQKTVNRLVTGNYDEKEVDNIVKNFDFNYDKKLKENRFWENFYHKRLLYNDGLYLITKDDFKRIMTKENMDKFMSTAVDENRYMDIRLVPTKYGKKES